MGIFLAFGYMLRANLVLCYSSGSCMNCDSKHCYMYYFTIVFKLVMDLLQQTCPTLFLQNKTLSEPLVKIFESHFPRSALHI